VYQSLTWGGSVCGSSRVGSDRLAGHLGQTVVEFQMRFTTRFAIYE